MKQNLDAHEAVTCEMGYRCGAQAKTTYDGIPCCNHCYGMAAAEAMWDFLVEGNPPLSFVLPEWKPLEPRQAMTIIYVIQEFLAALPDTWDMCSNCKLFFNTEREYYIVDEKLGILCENCAYLGESRENDERSD